MDPRAGQYYQYLLSKGLAPQVAAALVGNAGQESSFDPSIVGDKGNSLGLFQFNKASEQPYLRAWAAQQGVSPTDPYAQLDFIRSRLQSPTYADTYKAMVSAPDVAGATKAFMSGYERPSPRYANLGARVNYANAVAGLPPAAPGTYSAPTPAPASPNASTPSPTSPIGALFGPPAAANSAPDASKTTNPMDYLTQLGMGLLSAGQPQQNPLPPMQGYIHRPEFFNNAGIPGLLG